MVARYSTGEYADHQLAIGRIITEADELRAIALRLAGADAEAFAAVAGAYKLLPATVSCRPAGLSLSESNRGTAASVAGSAARMILAARPSLCRWRIGVIAAMCGASFAAPRARAAPAGGLAAAGGDPRPAGCRRRRRSGLGWRVGAGRRHHRSRGGGVLTAGVSSGVPSVCRAAAAFGHSNRSCSGEMADSQVDSQRPAPGRHSRARRCTGSAGRSR
jgi:hypothetical protein